MKNINYQRGIAPVAILLAVIAVLAVVGGAVLMSKKNNDSALESPTPIAPTMSATPINSPDNSGGSTNGVTEPWNSPVIQNNGNSTSTVKEFLVVGTSFKFSMNEIRVKKGDTVKIVFNSEQGFHDWVIDEFKARTKQLKAGESETIQFVADKVGTFEYYCSVGTHRASGMKGSLIVTE